MQKNNCEIQYYDFKNDKLITDQFYDSNIYNIGGECYFWSGDSWHKGVSYGGTPIMERLKSAYPKNKNDPPKF